MKFHLLCTFSLQRKQPLCDGDVRPVLIICVTVLCLQAKANIVSNKGEKRLLNNVSLFPQVSSFFFSERLIKFMQMTLSPLETCKCGPCIAF